MTTESSAIVTEGLTKNFGAVRAVDRLDLSVQTGTVCGFLGRNGAGKTTTIKMLVGLLRATDGGGTVLGRPIGALGESTMERIGYVSQTLTMYGWATVEQIAHFCAGLNGRWDWTCYKHFARRFELPADRKVAELSSGMKVKAALLMALAPKPDLLLLDEPAAGLDTIARRDFLDSLVDVVQQEGKTVFFSSHILSDVERIIDRVVFLDAGRAILSESLDTLQETVKRVQVIFENGIPTDFAVPNTLRRVQEGSVITLTVSHFEPSLLDQIHRQYGARAQAFDIALEDMFVDLLASHVGDKV